MANWYKSKQNIHELLLLFTILKQKIPQIAKIQQIKKRSKVNDEYFHALSIVNFVSEKCVDS